MFMLYRPPVAEGPACKDFGPQTPRDIDDPRGVNPQKFSFALPAKKMNLCNIHFHENAEHKAKDFSIYEDDGKHSSYICNISKTLTNAEKGKYQAMDIRKKSGGYCC